MSDDNRAEVTSLRPIGYRLGVSFFFFLGLVTRGALLQKMLTHFGKDLKSFLSKPRRKRQPDYLFVARGEE